VSFDLNTRKAVEIPPDLRAAITEQLIPGLGI